MELAAGTQVERYTLVRPLGSGGLATVHLVRHDQIGSLHALKVLTTPSRAVRERFLREARVQGTLRHPNVVAVTDVVDVGGAPGLVLEYVNGPTLAEFLARHRPTRPQVDLLARGILRAVAAAHRMGLVHRDLKPANVLLQVNDGSVVPKVADFGLAKILQTAAIDRTRSGVVLGTPSYMAPEQIRDSGSVDARADVFSLGALLHELCSGRRAFPGTDDLQRRRVGEDRPAPRARARPPRALVHDGRAVPRARSRAPLRRRPGGVRGLDHGSAVARVRRRGLGSGGGGPRGGGLGVVVDEDGGGLRQGDRVVFVDGRGVERARDVATALHERTPGGRVRFTVTRDGRQVDVDVPTLQATGGARPRE